MCTCITTAALFTAAPPDSSLCVCVHARKTVFMLKGPTAHLVLSGYTLLLIYDLNLFSATIIVDFLFQHLHVCSPATSHLLLHVQNLTLTSLS